MTSIDRNGMTSAIGLSAKRWLMKIFFGFSSLDIIFPLVRFQIRL